MHSRCSHSHNSPHWQARRAEFLAQILEPAYQSQSYSPSSPSPSTSSLPLHPTNSLPSSSTTTTKAYKDCQGIVHDPEWRYFPTEEWKKQRRARRTYYQQHQLQSEWVDSRSLEEEDRVRSTTMPRSRRSFERDEEEDGDHDDWDEKEYAFGGKKNRTRYRSFGYPSVSNSNTTTTGRASFDSTESSFTPPSPLSIPQIKIHQSPTRLSLSPPSLLNTPELSRTSTVSSPSGSFFEDEEEEPHAHRKSSRLSLGKIFKRHRRCTEEEEEEEEPEVDVVPSSSGLGLTGVDRTSSRVRFDALPSSPRSTSPPSPSKSTSSTTTTTLRSRAYKQYLSLELSITLGLVRTERRWRDWSKEVF